jgi:hypothetical protein
MTLERHPSTNWIRKGGEKLQKKELIEINSQRMPTPENT